VPAQTAECLYFPKGEPVVDAADQVLSAGLYSAPVSSPKPGEDHPPQMIIFVPAQTAPFVDPPEGAPVVEVAVHESAAGSYSPPSLLFPPQTIIRVPVQNPACSCLPEGTDPVTEVGTQELPAGSVIVYAPLVTAESDQPERYAIALIVVVSDTAIEPAYTVPVVEVGSEPSIVYRMLAAGVDVDSVTPCALE
jgi:hypothetical protein